MGATPSIRFDPASPVPAIRQITDSLRVLLVNGRLAPGVSLPSVRRMAMELGVHFNTVAEAYRQIAAEGWLDLQHGRGAVVIARSIPQTHPHDWVEEFRDRLHGLIAQVRAEGAEPVEVAAELRDAAKVVLRS
ncbi:MAG: GntR family transcriptional regulator [Bryobacteraceae bacterium]